MEWVLRSPQIHTTFSNLGFPYTNGYHINENCNAALETILHNILTEDKCLRNYRRNISFGQNVRKDLIPLLINAKEDKTIELLIKIFDNLTTPIECLFNVEEISKTDFGRHTVLEINNLLAATKTALTDRRTTKVIVEFLKKNLEWEQNTKISVEQCNNISHTMLLLRNILHIADDINSLNPNYNAPEHTAHNQILWNLFSQGIDKVLIKLMTLPESETWGVTMVQIIALLYKDQHITTLHKLFNVWLETSLSESSEDNESNTSPRRRGRDDSSPMLTSDITSDSSDTQGSGKCNDANNSASNTWNTNMSTNANNNQFRFLKDKMTKLVNSHESNENNNVEPCQNNILQSNTLEKASQPKSSNKIRKTTKTNPSDCGYVNQIENQGSLSTSSNEDEIPSKKPVHQKPHTSKQRINNKSRPSNTTTLQERKRRKIVKRGKSNIVNVQGLFHNTPTDDDISNILKEFTLDFLLKGFNSLVRTLHVQILTNKELKIDTSHFFWLVTYFLKFATQLKLDLDHVSSVLSFDMVSYLTAEGVTICEQFELAIKLDSNDLKPCIRRLHLVVTAIREFVQAIHVYKKSTHLSCNDQRKLLDLQMKICETEELQSLLVLLLRQYNPKYHSKQYLQDLVVTNHILLIALDHLMKLPEYKGIGNMVDYIKLFANPEIMSQYGHLLEDYEQNGEFVNDCVFTMMHHVVGELDSLGSLFQPKILKTFTAIWKSKFEICDDWSDLIEYAINVFVKKPQTFQNKQNVRPEPQNLGKEKVATEAPDAAKPKPDDAELLVQNKSDSSKNSRKERWTESEIASLNWNYMQCSTLTDAVGEIVKIFKEDGIKKSRDSVIRQLLKQSLISKDEFDKLIKMETESNSKALQAKKEMRNVEIGKLCEQITKDGKSKFLDWVQRIILETCHVKLYLEKGALTSSPKQQMEQFVHSEVRQLDLPTMSPVSYYSLLFEQPVPLVPWNCEQAAICKDLKFLQLLHKLGFQMPVDTGKVFIRIPHVWTPDFLYEVAAKISPIDTSKLKFSLNDISKSTINFGNQSSCNTTVEPIKDASSENVFNIQKHSAIVANFTPMPGPSFTSSIDEGNKPNWLEMVQKAQECNLNLNGHQRMVSEDNKKIQTMTMAEMVASMALPNGLPLGPNVDTKHDAGGFSAQQQDPEYCNNSVCDTASVASDLTRMYVSDEDEKDEDLLSAPHGSTPRSALPAGICICPHRRLS